MQTIITKYLGSTSHRGSRIKAMQSSKGFNGERAYSITRPYDYSLDVDENHTKVAKEFADQMGWSGNWISGSIDNHSGYVFVNSSRKNEANSFTCSVKEVS
jgi:hypothetical protein